MPLRGWSGWVRYGLPGVVVGLALALWLDGRGPAARAQGGEPPSAIPMPHAAERSRGMGATPAIESGGTIAFSSPAGGSGQFLYLIDTKSRAFAVYRVDPANPKGTVKLEAARQYQWDLKLDEYNNQEPNVAAIESTVKSLGHPNR
jgi:hypothetical protein